MKKKLKDIGAIYRALLKAERSTLSFVEAAVARALRHAEVTEVAHYESATPEGSFKATLYKLALKGRSAVVVAYDLYESWGSLDYDHGERGVAFCDRHTGQMLLLDYEGQHAGNEEFQSWFSNWWAELHRLMLLGQVEFRRVGGPEWAPRLAYEAPRRFRRPRRPHRRPSLEACSGV